MNKKIIAYTILPIIGLALLGAGATFAASNGSVGKPMSTLVNAIAKKFNLNTTDVQTVVDQVMTEQRTQMEAERTKEFSDRIAQAVTDKKLTQEQADKIIAKQAEEKAFRESLTGKTEAEIQAAQKEHRAAMQKWATDNNIPTGFMMMGKGPGGGHGPKGSEFEHQGLGFKKNSTKATTK